MDATGYRVYRDSRSGLCEADEQAKGLGSDGLGRSYTKTTFSPTASVHPQNQLLGELMRGAQDCGLLSRS